MKTENEYCACRENTCPRKHARDIIPNMVLKPTAALVPIVGPYVAAMIDESVPNRLDRVARLAEILEDRVGNLELFQHEWTQNEHFRELIMQGIEQVARNPGKERREHIASIICNGLTADQRNYDESHRFLRILSDLSDTEIVFLMNCAESSGVTFEDKDWRVSNEAVLEPVVATMGSSPETRRKSIMQDFHYERLFKLGLLEESRRENRTALPRSASSSLESYIEHEERRRRSENMEKRLERPTYAISEYGRLFLSEIGIKHLA